MASETTTPNIGLQIPAYNQPNWQVPIVYDLTLLDLIFGGGVTVPALSVTTLTIGNIGATLAAVFVNEVPSGTMPGTVFTLSYTPSLLLAFCYNGAIQRYGIDYTLATNVVTLNFTPNSGDTVYAIYLR